jgi:hypothetical protein
MITPHSVMTPQLLQDYQVRLFLVVLFLYMSRKFLSSDSSLVFCFPSALPQGEIERLKFRLKKRKAKMVQLREEVCLLMHSLCLPLSPQHR